MTVAEMITERVIKVTAAFDEANETISIKGGYAAADLHGLAAAIATIPQGSSITVEPLSVTENGSYTADQGKAFSPVTVNVPTSSLPTGFSMLTPPPLPDNTRMITIDFDDISHVLAVVVMCGRTYIEATQNIILSCCARASTSRNWVGTDVYASSTAGSTTSANQTPNVAGNSITIGHPGYGYFIGGAQYYIFVYKEAA